MRTIYLYVLARTRLQPGTARTILIWAVITIASGLSAILGWWWSTSTAQLVTHTVQVQNRLGDLVIASQDVEAGQRGYFLTKDKTYLERYNDGKAAVFAIHSDILRSVADNPKQTELMSSIRPLLAQRLATSDASIALFEAGKVSDAIAIVKSERGKTFMDDIRAKITDARQTEVDYYAERETAFQRQRYGLLMALVGMLFASATLAMVSVSRERERRETIEAAARLLKTSNQELEKRVVARTAEIEIEKSRAETERERAEGLLRDVTHRVGNSLALVVGFINLHIRHATNPQSIEILTGARSRIHAIASAQRRLNVANDLELVRIDTLVEQVLSDLSSATIGDTEIAVEIPPLLAAAQFATSLCVLIQEFVMNSVKHAFPEGRAGKITVSLRQADDQGGILEIIDNGKGMSGLADNSDASSEPAQNAEGLGAKIATLLSRQFGGTISYSPASSDPQWPGTRVHVALPEFQLVRSTEAA
ncbi:MAG: CHASE3 domain-containing protein [Hyphomicrobium sp.]|nr:CHASE3 domain-containing protein [Hyphomicrobium sp.]